MSGILSFEDFANIGNGKTRVSVDELVEGIFDDQDFVARHLVRWYMEHYNRKCGWGLLAMARRMVKEGVGIANAIVNNSSGRIYEVGYGHGLFAYAAAKLTDREVVAIDTSEIAAKYGRSLMEKLEYLPNLNYHRSSLADVAADVQDGDALFAGCNGEVTSHILKVAKDRDINTQFDHGGWVPFWRFLVEEIGIDLKPPKVNYAKDEKCIRKKFEMSNTRLYIAPTECVNRCYHVLITQQNPII